MNVESKNERIFSFLFVRLYPLSAAISTFAFSNAAFVSSQLTSRVVLKKWKKNCKKREKGEHSTCVYIYFFDVLLMRSIRVS